MSAPGQYRKLRAASTPWSGVERRSAQPLNQMARSLGGVCTEAVDAHEVAAYLESLGYNRYRVQADAEMDSTFELADKLFARTPRRSARPRRKVSSYPLAWLRPASLLLTLGVTFLLQTQAAATEWETVLWLIIWAALGVRLVLPTVVETREHQKQMLTLTLGLGLLGLLATSVPGGVSQTEIAVGLLWWNLTGNTWLEQLQRRSRFMHAVLPPLLVLATGWLAVLWLSALAVLLVSVASFWSVAALPTRMSVSRLPQRADQLGLVTLFGLGQGFLFITLMDHPGAHLRGMALFVTALLAGEVAARLLNLELKRLLWSAADLSSYGFRVQFGTLSFLTLLAAVPVLTSVGQPLLGPEATAFIPYPLLAAALSLATFLLSLNNLAFPSYALSLAALGILLGLPLGFCLLVLCGCLAVGLLVQLRAVETYAVHLL